MLEGMNGRKQQTTGESETVQTTKVRQPRLRVAPERRDEGNKANTASKDPPTTTRSVAPLSPADTNVVHKREGRKRRE